METRELRIGNYVDTINGVIEVIDVLDFGINMHHDCWIYSAKDIKPIPLTEEWLLKFGFKPQKNYGRWYQIGNAENYFEDEELENETQIEVSINSGHCVISQHNTMQMNHVNKKIEYVHQLQNLYFALMGEELEVKKPELN